MNRRTSIYTRFRRYWLSELGLGNRSRLGNIVYWITLRPLWKLLRRTFGRWFQFHEPSWVQNSAARSFATRAKVAKWNWINPAYWILWVCNFLYEWIVSRPYFALGPAIPGVVVAIAMCFVVYLLAFSKNAWRDDFYRSMLTQATTTDDDQLTRLALANLADRDPEQSDLRIRLALLDEKMGYKDAALHAMSTLAVQRNPTAAYWLALNSYPLTEVEQWNEEKHQQFRSLMAIAQSESSTSGVVLGSRVLMAQYLVDIGATAEAIVNLESVADENKDLLLVTASLHDQLNNKERAKVYAVRAEAYFRNKLLSVPTDVEARMNLAKALLIQGRAEDVATTLSDGFQITKNPQLLIAGGEALAGWANQIQSTQPPTEDNLLKRLQLVTRAVELAPQNHVVLESVINTALQCTDSVDPKVAKQRADLLGKMDADKLHFIQGTVELLKGNYEEADAHLQLAAANTSNIPGVLNNLAVVLSQKKDPDLERALALANAALKKAPDQSLPARNTRADTFENEAVSRSDT